MLKCNFNLVSDLSSSRLDHELAGKVRRWLRLKRSDYDALVKRISWHDL